MQQYKSLYIQAISAKPIYMSMIIYDLFNFHGLCKYFPYINQMRLSDIVNLSVSNERIHKKIVNNYSQLIISTSRTYSRYNTRKSYPFISKVKL